MMPEGYAAIPSWMLRDQTISGPAVMVYAALASRAGFRSIHPGQPTLAAEARCGERRVRDALKELEDRGLIERVVRRYANGQRASDGYVLHSGMRPSALVEQPAVNAGSESQPAESDVANRQNPTSIPLIEITKEDITTSTNGVRDDVKALLDLLDEEIQRNDARKVPKRNKGNADAMRLLMDRDGYTAAEVEAVIRWAQADQFWYVNILSASKLREKFPVLLGQMQRGRGSQGSHTPASRALGVDLGQSPGAAVNGAQMARVASGPSIAGEIAAGRWPGNG